LFYIHGKTGIDDTYFQNAPVEEIVSHIISLYGSKMLAYAREDQKLDINLEKESENNAVSLPSALSVPIFSWKKVFEKRLQQLIPLALSYSCISILQCPVSQIPMVLKSKRGES